MEDNMGNFSAYEGVESLLLDLKIILLYYDRDLGSGKSFSSLFERTNIRTMYDNLKLMKSLFVDSSGEEYDKKLPSGLEIWIADTAYTAQNYIVSRVWSLMGLNIDKRATAQSFTLLNMLLRISNEDLHFVIYDAVVMLLHDLELQLSFSRRDEYLFIRRFIADKEIVYDNLSMMDSLLLDSSGQGYDKKLMSGLESLICFVAHRGLDYIEPRPRSSTPGPSIAERSTAINSAPTTDFMLDELTESIEFINEKLKRISDNREVIHKSTQNLERITCAGLFLAALNLFRKTTREGSKLETPGQDLLTMLDHPEPNIEHQTSSSIDGETEIFDLGLCQITRTIESVNKKLKKIRDGRDVIQKSTQSLQDATSTSQVFTIMNKLCRTPNEEGKLVGFEQDLSTMLDRLTGYPSKLQVFAVVGMGGIGKTTFTKRLYDDPLVKYHFHVCAWFTVSQQYQVKEVLIGLVRCLIDPMAEINERSNEELKLKIHKNLKGKTYLIVLDDMWDKQAWDDLRKIFPDDENGSRIILTTRLKDVAIYASPSNPPHYLPLLSSDESWELFCSKIFINELCPPELEPIGKQITCKCQGLPLAIVVIAGLLSKMHRTLEVWRESAKSVCSLVMEKPEQFKNLLALSFNHLPDHLKSCFLYMGIFPEDSMIPAKKLIWLWIGEGFIRPGKLKSFEEVAENYLEDLVGRSLIQVNRRRSDGGIKTCYIHDMLRDLCLRESHKKKFFHVYKNYRKSMKQIDKQLFLRKCRRFCFQSSIPDSTTISSLCYARSFLWFKIITSSDLVGFSFSDFTLLKVLDINDVHLEELPWGMHRLVNLRYLALSFQKYIDRSIFRLSFHNIQILIIEGEWNGQLPKDLWAMSELQHFHLKRSFLSYWPEESRPNIIQLASESELPSTLICCREQYEKHSLKILQNLQSFTTMRPISCTEQVFRSMPNLKKLGVYENEEDRHFRGWFEYLIHLKELQTLKYVFRDPFVSESMRPVRLPPMHIFLPGLINLTLSGTSFPWEDMLKLYALPKLEVLKLKNYAFFGTTWTLELEGVGFPHLRYLLIRTTNLQLWVADGTHFPCLRHLVIINCRSLKEIPCGIFEAPQLEKIELDNCSESAATSAKQIQQERLDDGYDGPTIHIT